jgi:hypothetical protein
MPEKRKDDTAQQVREALARLQELSIESLSDADLASVARSALCSLWCCSNKPRTVADLQS